MEEGEEPAEEGEAEGPEQTGLGGICEIDPDACPKLDFDKEVPDFKGHAAELSLSFWSLIRFAMAAALKSEKKEFSLTTGHDDENVFVLMKHSGEESGTLDANRIESISAALEILEKYSARVEFDRENGISTVTIRIPCR